MVFVSVDDVELIHGLDKEGDLMESCSVEGTKMVLGGVVAGQVRLGKLPQLFQLFFHLNIWALFK